MIHGIPTSWRYSNDMEMLFLLYQRTDELLSDTTSDSYVLPQHNTYTLVFELQEIYGLLKKYNIVEEHYKNYIVPIIEEFLAKTEEDYIVKKKIGKRLSSIRTGFEEAKEHHAVLKRWIDIFKQAVSFSQYKEAYRAEIERLVIETNDKNKLQVCLENYYICLVYMGYTREHLYISTKKFFNNAGNQITRPTQVRDFLIQFTGQKKSYEFLLLMDTDSIDYLNSLTERTSVGENIKKIDIPKERDELCKDFTVKELFQKYDRLKSNEKGHKNITIVKYVDDALDPYACAIEFVNQIRFTQGFMRYFKHFYFAKQIHKFLIKGNNGYYRELNLPSKLQKRPFVHQDMIDSRIKNILSAKSMGKEAFISLARAIDMHAEALDSQNTITLLRTFWTALETLFSAPDASNKNRENVINSVLAIIQKTYILKLLRELFAQLNSAIEADVMVTLGINTFEMFVKYFSKYDANSTEMKKIYAQLSKDPLLRSRLFNIRERLKSGELIKSLLNAHKTKVTWQLKRLYRIRNVATHLGVETSGIEVAVNHLHNYFDFAINYMLCKSENENYIISMSSLVYETKNDNNIHYEMLKTNESLSVENFMEYLFGPDANLINYIFEY